MNSNRRLIGILIIVFGLAVIIAIVYFGFLRQAPGPADNGDGQATPTGQLPGETAVPTTTPGDQPRNEQRYDIASEPAHEFGVADLEKMAMAFSERLGSYSSQSDYSNLTDLKIYMTASLQDWASDYADKLRSDHANTAYYGISTTAIYATVKSFDKTDGTASVTVTTERRESTAAINGGEPFRQDIDLNFKEVNGQWLVDSAYWAK